MSLEVFDLLDMSRRWMGARARGVAFGALLAASTLTVSAVAAESADRPAPLPDPLLAMTAMLAGDDPNYLAFEARFRDAGMHDRATVQHWVQRRFDASPTAANRLRLAIVRLLSTRGANSLRQVREELEFLTSLEDLLSETEQNAARVYLARVEREVLMQRRIATLERRSTGLVRDLGDADRDIALLKGQVDMLRRQIERLTDIERVIDEGNRQTSPFDVGLAHERDEAEAGDGDEDPPAVNAEQGSEEDDS